MDSKFSHIIWHFRWLLVTTLIIFTYAQENGLEVTKASELLDYNMTSPSVKDNQFRCNVNAYGSVADLMEACFPNLLILIKIMSSLIIFCGLVGNLLSAFIWAQFYRRNSAAVYLIALSLNDFFVILIQLNHALIRFWKVYTPEHTGHICIVIKLILPINFQYASNIYVLAFTFERWFAVSFPFQTERICSAKRAAIISVLICISVFIICFATYSIYDPKKCIADKHFSLAFEVTFTGIIPLVVLVLNILLVRAMLKITKADRKFRFGKNKTDSKSDSPNYAWVSKSSDALDVPDFSIKYESIQNGNIENIRGMNKSKGCDRSVIGLQNRNSSNFKATTIMLLIVSNYMVITCFLAGLMYCLQFFYFDEESTKNPEKWNSIRNFLAIKPFVDQLATSNFAVGIFIYLATGSNFRSKFEEIFHFKCWKRRNPLLVTNGGSQQGTQMVETSQMLHMQDQDSGLTILVRMKKNFSKRSEFPGLEDCGKRDMRKPSRLRLYSECQDEYHHKYDSE